MRATKALRLHAPQLAGSVAVVTGAGSGIGAAVASLLAREGASVALLDRDGDAAQRVAAAFPAAAPPSLSLACDVADGAAVDAAFEAVEAELGPRVAFLVNSAGITRDNWLWRLTEADWDAVMDVNLKGSFHTTQRFARGLLAAAAEAPDAAAAAGAGGSVVNISSIVGKSGNMGQTNYAASKAGVVGFTKSAARELARHAVRVNAIQPGFIDTPMARAVPEHVIEKMTAQVPLQALGEPDDIAHAVRYLLAPESKYVTGVVLEVSGGLFM